VTFSQNQEFKYCQKCGVPLNADAKFCSVCRAQVLPGISYVIISYEKRDSGIAQKLIRALEETGIRTLPSITGFAAGILPGSDELIKKSFALIVVISRSSIRSGGIIRTIKKTSRLGKPVIPLFIGINVDQAFEEGSNLMDAFNKDLSWWKETSGSYSEILPRVIDWIDKIIKGEQGKIQFSRDGIHWRDLHGNMAVINELDAIHPFVLNESVNVEES